MPSDDRRLYAIVPAAGISRRMRPRHKLLLPWRGSTVLRTVLTTWSENSVEQILVVARRQDHAVHEQCRFVERCQLILPEVDPADMKQSVQIAVRYIEEHLQPTSQTRCLVAPADLPTLTDPVIQAVISASQQTDYTVAPLFGDRPGHPLCLPWNQTPRLFQLGTNQGINQLLKSGPVEFCPLSAELRPEDIDTPEDFERLSAIYEQDGPR